MNSRSEKTYEKLCEVIPGGVNSPVRAFKDVCQTPLVVERGFKDRLVDVDGKEYIDFCGSWGALIHGHAHPQILEKLRYRMELGTTFGATTPIEEKIAQKIVSLIPSIQKIRFVSSGTEATMSALRLARGFTERDLFIKFNGNYHGHADPFLVQAGSGVAYAPSASSKGVPAKACQDTLSLPYNDVEAVKAAFKKYPHQIAAVIVEPISGNMGVVPGTPLFLETLRQETENHGALLIFDEVITGFRVGKQGAQGLYGITPDLTCLGKIIGGGLPAAAFGGRRDVMDALAPLGGVYQAGTLSGNPLAMEAGLEALALLERPGFYEELEDKTLGFIEPLQQLIQKRGVRACIQRVGSMFTLFFGRESVNNMEEAKTLDHLLYAKFFRELFQKGIYFPPSQYEACFVSGAHSEESLKKFTLLLESL